MPSKPRTRPLHVTIVSANQETLEDLRAYFDESGVSSDGVRVIRALSKVAATSTAVVLFPDDFDGSDVNAMVVSVRRMCPRLLVLFITRERHKYIDALAPDGHSVPPLVLPKPSFGWAVLDAIRAHAELETVS